MNVINEINKLGITPNVMQKRVLTKLFGEDDDYSRSFIMAGTRSGRTTLANLIAYCHILSYLPVESPKIIFVLPIKDRVDEMKTYSNDVSIEISLYSTYISTPKDFHHSTMTIIDNVEMVEYMYEDEFEPFMDKVFELSNSVVILGGMSQYLTNLMLSHVDDDETYLAHYPTWKAIGQPREDFMKQFEWHNDYECEVVYD